MSERRERLIVGLNDVHRLCVEYQGIWLGKHPAAEADLRTLTSEVAKLRDHFLDGATHPVAAVDAQLFRDLTGDFEACKSDRPPKFSDDLQFLADTVMRIALEEQPDPSGPHGELRFPSE